MGKSLRKGPSSRLILVPTPTDISLNLESVKMGAFQDLTPTHPVQMGERPPVFLMGELFQVDRV